MLLLFPSPHFIYPPQPFVYHSSSYSLKSLPPEWFDIQFQAERNGMSYDVKMFLSFISIINNSRKYIIKDSQGSSVSIVSGYLRSRFVSWHRQRIFPLTSVSRPGGPPSLLYNGYRSPFPRAKVWPGHDTDHSPPSSAEVEDE
jgi:hypothetical protein